MRTKLTRGRWAVERSESRSRSGTCHAVIGLAGPCAARTLSLVVPMRAQPSRWRKMQMLEQHRTLREGLTAGVLGATAVAVWFLILDTIAGRPRSEEHTSELQSLAYLVCRLLLEKKKYSK